MLACKEPCCAADQKLTRITQAADTPKPSTGIHATRPFVQELASGLPDIETLDAAAVSKLEHAAAASAVRRPKEDVMLASGAGAGGAVDATDDGTADALRTKEKKRKKRKPRYPAGYDAANPGPPPDPERWLPKWQRSDFKKPRNRASRKAKVLPADGCLQLQTKHS